MEWNRMVWNVLFLQIIIVKFTQYKWAERKTRKDEKRRYDDGMKTIH